MLTQILVFIDIYFLCIMALLPLVSTEILTYPEILSLYCVFTESVSVFNMTIS